MTEPPADDSAGVKGESGEVSDGGAQSHVGAPTDALAALGSALLKAAKTKPSSDADQTVSAAFALGWHMSELRGEDPDGTQLPGLSKLGKEGRLIVTVTQVVAGVNVLKEAVAGAGLDPIDLTAVKGLMQTLDDADPVHATHVRLLTELTAADPRLGKAYGLGRALADSCHQPANFDGLKKELNPYRIANLLRWLDDLASAFPAHAAHSVETSLTRWRDALYPPDNARSRGGLNPRTQILSWRDRRRRPRPISVAESDQAEQVVKALRRQGELWCALLSGEKAGSDMLEIDNYLDAGKQLVHRMAVIARRAALRMPLLTIVALALTGLGVWLLARGSGSQLVAGATSVIVALGLTWKGLGGALGQLAGKLEQPLWGAVLDDAIADAITLLPDNNAETGGRRQVALDLNAGEKADGAA